MLAVLDDGCDSAECLAVREQCGERAFADVLMDGTQIAEVICLTGDVRATEAGTETIADASIDNGTLLILDGGDDGDEEPDL